MTSGSYNSQATCDTQILGYFTPKGTEVVLHIGHAGMHDTVENAIKSKALDERRGIPAGDQLGNG